MSGESYGEELKITTELKEFDEDIFDLEGNLLSKEAIGEVPPKLIIRNSKEGIVVNLDFLNTEINGGVWHDAGLAYYLSPELPDGEDSPNFITKSFLLFIVGAMYDVAIAMKVYIEIGVEMNGVDYDV